MRHLHVTFWLCLAAAALAACGPSAPGDDGDDTPPAPDASGVDAPPLPPDGPVRACDPARGNTCDGNTVVVCNPDGTIGIPVEECAAGTECRSGMCTRSCTGDGLDLIYTVDTAKTLRSFDPRKLGTSQDPFTTVGILNCPAGPPIQFGAGRTPFSMSIDRSGVAWVLYTSGQIFKVSIHDASCEDSGYTARQGGMNLFGMGFVSDAVGSDAERLYIGGGNVNPQVGNRRLGAIDTAALTMQPLGTLSAMADYTPELTGTGAAELFGFYPGSTHAFVQQVDKASGAPVGPEWQIPNGLGGSVLAWGFAHWGGKFYVFVTTGIAPPGNSTVRVLDRQGHYELARDHLPFQIVGAGVSTCAPTEDPG